MLLNRLVYLTVLPNPTGFTNQKFDYRDVFATLTAHHETHNCCGPAEILKEYTLKLTGSPVWCCFLVRFPDP